MINAETSELESMGVNISISRSMFDGKMVGILSGGGGAKCHLCTATNEQIKDLTLIRSGFSINGCIEDAKQIFIDVNIEEFLKLSSEHRFGLTHLPASEKDITPVFPPSQLPLRIALVDDINLSSGCRYKEMESHRLVGKNFYV